jgi:hypothetical protein
MFWQPNESAAIAAIVADIVNRLDIILAPSRHC